MEDKKSMDKPVIMTDHINVDKVLGIADEEQNKV